MNKAETSEVMNAFADCLRLLYQKAGLKIPEAFDPSKEAERLACVLNGYVEYQCGCLAGPLEVPNYCPIHGPSEDEIDTATPEQLDAMIESIPVVKLPTEEQCESEIKAQARMVARLRDADHAQQEQNLHDNMLSLDGPI